MCTETKAIRHSFEFSADSCRMVDTSQTSWTFGRMPWDENGMGSTALGSEEPRTTGGTSGRSGRALGGTGGPRGGFSWYGSASSARDSGLGGSRRTLAAGCRPDEGQHSEETWSGLQSPMACPLLSKSPLAAGCVPMWWRRSITFPIDKSNNKQGCNAVRLVNAFSPDSKAFYSYLWRRQPQTQQKAYASGCTAHRSRLESIAQSVNVAERLRKARISFVITNYDVPNAHPSPSHSSLLEALVDTLQDGTGLLRKRHELATMEIQGADEGILIRPGSDTAQGSEGAADAIHSVYHKCIDQWSDHLRAELLQEALIFKPPPAVPDLFSSPVFMGLTTYADDVRVTSRTTEPVHTLSRVMANDAALDNALEEMAQNTAKQEHSVLFAGQRARQYMASLYGTGGASWLDSCRASHSEFGAFFRGAGGLHSVFGSGITSLASPGLRIFGPFHLGSWAQDDERKRDNHYETGRWHGKKSAQ